jgi:aminoglycoside 6'-N-acetyltransferase
MLETERLLLRRFGPEDATALAAYRSDPNVSRYQSWISPVSVEQARVLVAELAVGEPRDDGWFQYAVERKGRPGLIGDVGVHRRDAGRQAEVGFSFAVEHQGRGYATEAVRRVVEYLLVEEGLHRVTAECDARNDRSARLLERVGFRREGHLVSSTWMKGEWTDDLLFAVLAGEWP